jgi:putative transposase
MPKLFHPKENAVFFITYSCYNKQPYFEKPEAAELVIEQIDRLRENEIWFVPEFVVMPDHVHLIVFPIKPLGYCLQEFKKSVARLLNRKQDTIGRKIWLDEYHERAIRDEREYRSKCEYIWNNPVKEGLAGTPELFAYSSANPLRNTDRDKFI